MTTAQQSIAGQGVRANCVAPSSVLTDMNCQLMPPDVQRQVAQMHPSTGTNRRAGGRRRGSAVPRLQQLFMDHRHNAGRSRRQGDDLTGSMQTGPSQLTNLDRYLMLGAIDRMMGKKYK